MVKNKQTTKKTSKANHKSKKLNSKSKKVSNKPKALLVVFIIIVLFSMLISIVLISTMNKKNIETPEIITLVTETSKPMNLELNIFNRCLEKHNFGRSYINFGIPLTVIINTTKFVNISQQNEIINCSLLEIEKSNLNTTLNITFGIVDENNKSVIINTIN